MNGMPMIGAVGRVTVRLVGLVLCELEFKTQPGNQPHHGTTPLRTTINNSDTKSKK